MNADNNEWLAQVRRSIDNAKCAITSNSRLSEFDLADMASQLESIAKRCRAMVQETPSG